MEQKLPNPNPQFLDSVMWSSRSTAMGQPGEYTQMNFSDPQIPGIDSGPPAASADAAGNVDIPIPTIQNVVSTINLKCRLDLEALASTGACGAEYKPNCEIDELIGNVEASFVRRISKKPARSYAIVTMRLREPETTALIFAFGAVICAGATTEAQSKLAMLKYVSVLRKLGFPSKFQNFKVRNIVGICKLNFRIWVDGLARVASQGDLIRYRPEEIREVAIYRVMNNAIKNLNVMVYASGKIVIAGGQSKDDIYTAFQKIYPVVTECRRVSAMDCCDELSKMSIVDCKKESAEDCCDQLLKMSIDECKKDSA